MAVTVDEPARRLEFHHRADAVLRDPTFEAVRPGRTIAVSGGFDGDSFAQAVEGAYSHYYSRSEHHGLQWLDDDDRLCYVDVRREWRRRDVVRVPADVTLGEVRAMVEAAGGGPVYVRLPWTLRAIRLRVLHVQEPC